MGISVPRGLCALCDGSGMIKHAKQIILRIVPGARGCARYEVSLGEVGIGNLLVEAMIDLASRADGGFELIGSH